MTQEKEASAHSGGLELHPWGNPEKHKTHLELSHLREEGTGVFSY